MFPLLHIIEIVNTIDFPDAITFSDLIAAMAYFGLSLLDLTLTGNTDTAQFSLIIETTFSFIGVDDIPEICFLRGHWRSTLNIIYQIYIASHNGLPAITPFGTGILIFENLSMIEYAQYILTNYIRLLNLDPNNLNNIANIFDNVVVTYLNINNSLLPPLPQPIIGATTNIFYSTPSASGFTILVVFISIAILFITIGTVDLSNANAEGTSGIAKGAVDFIRNRNN